MRVDHLGSYNQVPRMLTTIYGIHSIKEAIQDVLFTSGAVRASISVSFCRHQANPSKCAKVLVSEMDDMNTHTR